MQETAFIILVIAWILIWILICAKTGVGRIGKIVSVFMALYVLMLIKSNIEWNIKPLEQEQRHNEYTTDSQSGFTEDKERNRREGILYTIDDAEKVTLTSLNGEICVKIPRWEGFSAEEWTAGFGHERCHMRNEMYDRMEYELLSFWDRKDAEEEIAADFEYYDRENILGDVYQMTVDGIEISYQPCYEFIYSQCIKWHYTVWADLGCGQFLKTEIVQGMTGDEATHRAYSYETVPREVTEPLYIEGVIEALYGNIEVCTAQGDAIPIVYREVPPENKEAYQYHNFSFGIVREYQTDVYREVTVCAELIESLYDAVKKDTIGDFLQREAFAGKELSIAEKMEYIKKEETGTLIWYDAGHARVRESSYPPTKYCLVEGADASEEFLVYREYDFWEDLYSYRWFPCKKDDAGAIRAQRGIYVYGADTQEHYFLSSKGNPYLCIVNRDAKENIESVVLYDFATPDYIGTLIYIDASSVRLCSYVRNAGTYGTETPWYLYDNRIDTGQVFFSMLEAWKVTEFLGESDALLAEDIGSAAYEREQRRTQSLVDTYLGQEINMSWDRKEHDVKSFQSASVYGYYYTSPENLYKVYRQPGTLAMEAPIAVATMQVIGFDEEIDILKDKNDRVAICVEGRFFLLEKSAEKTEELRIWEYSETAALSPKVARIALTRPNAGIRHCTACSMP